MECSTGKKCYKLVHLLEFWVAPKALPRFESSSWSRRTRMIALGISTPYWYWNRFPFPVPVAESLSRWVSEARGARYLECMHLTLKPRISPGRRTNCRMFPCRPIIEGMCRSLLLPEIIIVRPLISLGMSVTNDFNFIASVNLSSWSPSQFNHSWFPFHAS